MVLDFGDLNSKNKRAGILFLCQSTRKIFLILENNKWSVPTFVHNTTILLDAGDTIKQFYHEPKKIAPIELYISQDREFCFSTYVCLIDEEFVTNNTNTYCWARMSALPSNIHIGLKQTLTDQFVQEKLQILLSLTHELI